VTPNAEYRAAAHGKIKNLRPSNPRLPVRVDFDGGRGLVTVPVGSKWAQDETGQILFVQRDNGVLLAYVARGGIRQVPIPPSVDVELIAKYFPS
jgi:hypothetical protein